MSPSSPMVNHVERSPSAVRKSAAPIAGPTVPLAPTPATCATRWDAFSVVRTSSTGPDIFSALASFAGEMAAGVQSWYGEALSYGSATDTRYGTGGNPGQTSWMAAVRPPDVEK